MKAQDYLADYSKKASRFLDEYFDQKEKQAAKVSPLALEMIKIYRLFIGGKNFRGGFTKLGYECFGGKNEEAILSASLMVEAMHTALLIHDDVMDQDNLRRGRPTVHVHYAKAYRRFFKNKANHYGVSMAIDLGDAGLLLSHLILADSHFPDRIKSRVLRCFDLQILMTTFGQALDVTYESKKDLAESDILKIHHYKSANYTVTGPLQYGALFAGVNEKEIEKIENYGLPVGIAFQLRDDELGLFSDEKKLGKPIGSDIRENKNTLLHIKALELAGASEKKLLQSAYGNRNLTEKEVKKVQEITIKTGALAYSQNLSRKLVEKGKKFVPLVTSDLKAQDTLYKMADFMIERDS